MQEMVTREAGSWLAREEDGRVLEISPGGDMVAEASPDDGRPVAEAADLADHRVSYAAHFENDGRRAERAASVADRAARAMRDGGRYLDGSARPGMVGRPAGRAVAERERLAQFERDATAAKELRLRDEAEAEAEAAC
jgi:hypothetical protein